MLWVILQPLIIFGLFVFLATQIVLPFFMNKPVFWLFRKSERDLGEALDRLDDEKTKKSAEKVEKEIKKTRKEKVK